jgi:hypothetical protein
MTLPTSLTPDERGFLTGLCQMPDADYFKAPGVSQSELKHLMRSPAHYQANKSAPDESTKAQEFGDQFDRFLCDRENFQRKLAVKPRGMKFSTNVGKDWQAEQEAAGKEIIAAADYDKVCGMVDALWAHPFAAQILQNSDLQVCAFAPFTLGGTVQRKGKFDIRPRDGNFLADIKSTEDAREPHFIYQTRLYRYDIQAGAYLSLNNSAANEARDCFLFIVVEKEKPHGVVIYNMPAELDPNPKRIPTIAEGRRAYVEALQKYMECAEKNDWPCYTREVVEIGKWKEAA